MTRVLLVTVGGSPEPILQAVHAHQPDEVIFLCSAPPCEAPSLDQVTGPGLPCCHTLPDGRQERRPNLVSQLELAVFDPALQILAFPDPDDLADIHQRIQALCAGMRQRFNVLELLGDYSGGTKSMSAGLAMALVDQNAALSLVAGNRHNLIRIERSDGIRPLAVGTIRLSRMLRDQLPPLLDKHLYEQASLVLREVRQLHHNDLDPSRLVALEQLQASLTMLTHWDRFRWREALAAASTTPLPAGFPELIAWWQRVVYAHDWLDRIDPTSPITGYELVQDLLLNAERRGRRGWYDDAVARLYRALELLAQTYIQHELGIDHQEFWDDPDIRRDCREWNIRRGVAGLYWWLRQREGGTGLGAAASRQWRLLQGLLDARNQSLLGHGLRPVEPASWQSLQDRVSNLVDQALREAGCRQGAPPQQLPGRDLLLLPPARLLLGDAP
jgi:CRISPR-associated protein (TIGR02710 family)